MRKDFCAVELLTIRKAIVRTILVVYLLNLKQVFPLLENILVQLVPTCYCGKLGTWKFCYRRKEKAMND